MADTICRVCNQPLDQHFVELRGGVAHAGVYIGNHRSFCSHADNDRSYTLGQIAALGTIVRSLRQKAGRYRTRGDKAAAAVLAGYSYKPEADRDKLIVNLARWYPWKEWNEP